MVDYFSVFSLPRKLHLETASLEKQFYSLSRRLHPDRFSNRSAQEQESALQQSSQLNDAYRVLKDPVQRTRHLLTLEGVEIEEQSKLATDQARLSGAEKKQIIPPELLEEVFELNMQLAEMKAARQTGEEDPDLRKGLAAARSDFDEKIATNQDEMERSWARWDQAEEIGSSSEKDLAKSEMVVLLNQRSYLNNLLREVNDVLVL